MITSVYKYRTLIWNRAIAEFRHRYSGTGIGFGWNILHPAILIAIYSVVFGVILHRSFTGLTVPYPLFLCAGLLPWLSFVECITGGVMSFQKNAPYLKKLPVPEQVFVVQTAVTSSMSLFSSFMLLMLVAVIFGQSPSWHWLLLPLPFILLQIAGFGIGLILGTLNVFFPDISQIVNAIMRLAFWATPVLFPVSFFAEHGFGAFIMLNPATASLIAIRDLFLYQTLPSYDIWLSMIAWAVAWVVAGSVVLHVLRKELRDVL